MINAYDILVGKPEGKRPQGTPRSRWNDNIKADLGLCTGFISLKIASSEYRKEHSEPIKRWGWGY